MRIRIQVNKIAKLISTHLLKAMKKKEKYFQICTKTLEISNFFRVRLANFMADSSLELTLAYPSR